VDICLNFWYKLNYVVCFSEGIFWKQTCSIWTLSALCDFKSGGIASWCSELGTVPNLLCCILVRQSSPESNGKATSQMYLESHIFHKLANMDPLRSQYLVGPRKEYDSCIQGINESKSMRHCTSYFENNREFLYGCYIGRYLYWFS
jgi:hypothetical protein